LQQRACEYQNLPEQGNDYMAGILESMPQYAEDKESVLHQITDKHTDKETSDKAAWKVSKDDKEASRRASIAQGGATMPGANTVNNNNSANNNGNGNGFSAPSFATDAPNKPARPVSVDLLSMDNFNAASGEGSVSPEISESEQANIEKLFHRAVVAGTCL